MTDAYHDLMAFQRQTEALSETAQRLGWDQETVMAKGSAHQRAEERAAIETVIHARRKDPRIAEWLEQPMPDDNVAKAQLRLIKRSHDRAVKVPDDLVDRLTRLTSTAQGIWAEARAANRTRDFLPVLQDIIALKREEAAALSQNNSAYDALLDDYEPGTGSDMIAQMFDKMRPRLIKLREALGSVPMPAPMNAHIPKGTQLRLAKQLATQFGYDFNRGNLELAVHPFCSGSGADVRITTRIVEDDLFNCLYSTIHEVGHACYEQNINPDYALTPLGHGVSMGVHESQSRFYENQIGRSVPFTSWLFKQLKEKAGTIGIATADEFARTVNRVSPGFIRTESDEVHYNLHIMLRFDLERALIAGDLAVNDLEAAWNDRFLADFGLTVERPSQGMLQDVHWSVGLFGYFPTYSLGNVYAGCLYKAMKDQKPAFDAPFAKGDVHMTATWLRENIQRHGGLYEPADLITRACGFAPSEEPLLDYLEQKYTALFNL